MKVDESSLTGESLAVSKKPGSTVLAGAVVAEGEMDAVVSAIGKECFFGKTMALLDAPQEVGHLQQVCGFQPAVSSSLLVLHAHCLRAVSGTISVCQASQVTSKPTITLFGWSGLYWSIHYVWSCLFLSFHLAVLWLYANTLCQTSLHHDIHCLCGKQLPLRNILFLIHNMHWYATHDCSLLDTLGEIALFELCKVVYQQCFKLPPTSLSLWQIRALYNQGQLVLIRSIGHPEVLGLVHLQKQ